MRRNLEKIPLYVLSYLLWLVCVAACTVAVIQLRAAVAVLLGGLGANSYSSALVSQVILAVGGLAAFAYVVYLEGYFRESIGGKAPAPGSPSSWRVRLSHWTAAPGWLGVLRRFALAVAIPLGVILVSLLALELGLRLMITKP
jgi:hypothetical protein